MTGSGTGIRACETVNLLAGATNLNGSYITCAFASAHVIENSASCLFSRCVSNIAGTSAPQITHGTNTQLSFRGYNGGLTLSGSTAGCNTTVEFNSGKITLDATNTGGTILVRGIPLNALTDSSDGATVDTESCDATVLKQDEIIADISALSVISNPTIYTADSITRDVGDDDGGTVSNIQSIDGNYHSTGESLSGLTVTVTVDTTSLTENPNLIRIVGHYDGGGTGHYVDIQVYNYNLSQWENKGIMNNVIFDFDREFVIPVDVAYQDSGDGEMQVRFVHNVTTYLESHVLNLDYIG